MKGNSSSQSVASSPTVSESGTGISQSMSTLVQNIASAEQGKNTQQGVKDLDQGVSNAEELQPTGDNPEKESDKKKTPDGPLVIALKLLCKLFGVEINEEKEEKKDDKDVEKMLDALMNFLGLDKEKLQGLQGGFLEQLNQQNQSQNSNPKPSPQQQNNNNQGFSSSQQHQPKNSPEQNDVLQNPSQNNSEQGNSSPTSTQNKGETGNNDKFITTIIVGLYEKEGKLDSLKEILKTEKNKPENEKNTEMQNLIQGFDDQIKEVENGREQNAANEEQGKVGDISKGGLGENQNTNNNSLGLSDSVKAEVNGIVKSLDDKNVTGEDIGSKKGGQSATSTPVKSPSSKDSGRS